MDKRIRTNFIYNTIYEVFRIILPLITTPYISRILGSTGVGIFALAQTYASYFSLIAGFGFSSYAARELSYARDDKRKFYNMFWEIFIVRSLFFVAAIFVYFCIFFLFDAQKDISYKIYIVYLISSIFDVSYYFRAIENFKTISLRNIVIKIIAMVCVFAFIRNGNQTWLYTLIVVLSEFIGQGIMIISLDKSVWTRPEIKMESMLKHIKESFALFIPTLAIQVYTMLDKVMLGILAGESATGYYDNAQKMVRLTSSVASSLVSATSPRVAYCYAKGKKEEISNYFGKVFSFVSFIAFPMCFGLMGVATGFSSWYYGNNFEGIDVLVKAGAPLIISLGWSDILGNMVLVSTGNQKYYTIAVYISALVNILCNYFLIIRMKALGAIVSSVVAEVVGMLIMLYFSSKKFHILFAFKTVPKYLVSSVAMLFIMVIINRYIPYTIVGTIIEIAIGCFVYAGIMIYIEDENIMMLIDPLLKRLKATPHN